MLDYDENGSNVLHFVDVAHIVEVFSYF